MRLYLLAYCAGVMCASLVPDPIAALPYSVCAALLMALAATLGTVLKNTTGKRLSLSLLFAVLGITWHLLWAAHLLDQRLPQSLEGVDILVSGKVLDMPTSSGRAQQFTFFIEASDSSFVDRRVLLNLYEELEIRPGQRWQFKVRLNRPHGFANPAGFDYEALLFQKRIAGKGYVRADSNNRLLGESWGGLQLIRYQLRETLLKNSERYAHVGVMLALGMGERSQLLQSDWELLSNTGTNHLFIVSGLHIGLIAAVCYWLINRLVRLLPSLLLRVPAQKLAASSALCGALIYSLLAGFSLPTQRAFIMTAVFALALLCNRPLPMTFRFLLALLAVLSLNPLAAINAGFWLSFTAVAALLLCLKSAAADKVPLDASENAVLSLMAYWFRPQFVVFLALLPFLLYWTGQLSLLAPLVNVLAIPLVGFVIVPLSLLALLLLTWQEQLALWLLDLCDELIQLLFLALGWVAENTGDWSVVHIQHMGLLQLVFSFVAASLLLAPVNRRLKLLAVPLLLPLLLPVVRRQDSESLSVHVLDVGQGLAVIVQTQNHALVYDTGANLSPEFNLGSAVLAPVLDQFGIDDLDAVVISHFDNDHVGGLEGVMQSRRVKTLYSNNSTQMSARLHASDKLQQVDSLQTCHRGRQWQWDGIDFRFLHPELVAGAGNNDSCVLQVSLLGHSVLLPGDIERESERVLAREYGRELSSSILIAPHHGSSTSSSYAFIKQVMPDYVIYSAGYRNSFGHPTAQTSQRYQLLNAQQFATADTGMLSFTLQAGQPSTAPVQYRRQRHRYWY